MTRNSSWSGYTISRQNNGRSRIRRKSRHKSGQRSGHKSKHRSGHKSGHRSGHRTRQQKKRGFRIKGRKKSNKSTKFCKLLFSLRRAFILLFHHLFLRVRNYLTRIVQHGWLGSQLQVNDICEAQRPFFKIPSSRNVKTKSSKSLVCYVIRVEAPKVQDKYFPIMTWVKKPLVREYVDIWILKTINHNII